MLLSIRARIATNTVRVLIKNSYTNNERFYKTSYITSTIQSRNYSKMHRDELVMRRELKFKMQDQVPRDWDMIYRLPFLKLVQTLSVISTSSLIGVSGIAIAQLFTKPNTNVIPVTVDMLETGLMQYTDFEMSVFLTSLFALNFVVRMLINELALRVYTKDGRYKCVFLGIIPGMNKTLSYEASDVKPYKSLSVIPWGNHRHAIKRNVVIFLEDYFRTPSHMIEMLQPKYEEETK